MVFASYQLKNGQWQPVSAFKNSEIAIATMQYNAQDRPWIIAHSQDAIDKLIQNQTPIYPGREKLSTTPCFFWGDGRPFTRAYNQLIKELHDESSTQTPAGDNHAGQIRLNPSARS
ncbi:hypothetical protein ES703_125717 [subsurface metagenome]